MYKSFYGLHSVPFRRDTPAGTICRLPHFEEAAGRLLYTAKDHGFAVVTGPCGTGKTTLLRYVSEKLSQDRYKVIYMSDSSMTPGAFYRNALVDLGCAPRRSAGENKRQLASALKNMPGYSGLQPVFVLDEGHLFSLSMLEEIRFILNADFDSHSPAALILCGQDELLDTLRLVQMTPVRQRIDLTCALRPLSPADTQAYITHHLQHAGAVSPIFTNNALAFIHEFAGGVPRIIDKACTSLLLYGAQQQKASLDERDAELVIANEFIT